MRNRSASLALILALSISSVAAAAAQSVPGVDSISRTDLGLSVYGSFPQQTTGNGVVQSPANSAGGLFEVRHISNPILGFEGTYSFNHADQTIHELIAVTCPAPPNPCPAPIQTIKSNAHEVTADWVPSVHFVNARIFGVLGLGALFNVPGSNQSDTKTSTKMVYVYGGGLDWGLLPHFGIRGQYRGNLFSAPDVSTLYTSSKAFTHTAEPMIGIYLRL
ncbi:MAG TPA: outer membrane beta-barrel protein [Terracidiphilus sp.]|nr:outer membrane beta-barrel protein [Terracidiphilus sp.]